MVSKSRFITVSLLLLLAGLLAVGSWLLASRSGALWLLGRFGSSPVLKVGVGELHGSLLAGLLLQNLNIDWPGGQLRVDALQLDWQPQALLRQHLQIELLKGGALQLQLNESAAPDSRLSATETMLVPDIGPWLAPLGNWTLSLKRLQFESVELVRAGQQSISLKPIRASLEYRAQQLHLREVEIDGDFGGWQGDLNLEVPQVLLTGNLNWRLPRSLGPLETLAAELSLERTAAGRLQGPVSFKSHGQGFPDYRLAGNLRLDRSGLELETLKFERAGKIDGFVQGNLHLVWASGFSWQTELTLTELNLKPELGRETQLSGRLQFQGQKSSYSGHLDLKNSAEDWQLLSLKADLEGDAARLGLTGLQGRLLDGEVAGEVRIDWRDGIASTFKLHGQGLKLDRLPQGPEGQVDLQLDGWLKKAAGQDLQLGGQAHISKGVLLGREFKGDILGLWQGGRKLQLDNFDLQGAWGRLRAQGDLQQHLTLKLDLLDASTLWPPLSGAGQLNGWLAWTQDWPHGELNGHLQNLAYKEWRIAELLVTGKQSAARAPADLHLTLAGVQHGEVKIEGLDLKLQGLPEAHQVEMKLKQEFGQAALKLQAEYTRGHWQGWVSTLELKAPQLETFGLAQPFALKIDSEEVSLSEVLLQGEKGSRLNLTGVWNKKLGLSRAEGSWEALNLEVLQTWLPGVQFGGLTNGQASFSLDKNENSALLLQTDYVGALSYAGQKFNFDKLEVAGRWDRRGLEFDAEVIERGGGKLTLVASSPDDAGFALPQQGEIQLQLTGLPLALLNTKLPPGQELSGLLNSQMTGSWFKGGVFALAAQAAVEQGVFHSHAGSTQLEIPIEQTELSLDWQQQRLVVGLSLGLGGADGLAGDLHLQLPARWPLGDLAAVPIAGEYKFHLGKLGGLSLLVPEQLADFSGEISGALRLAGSLGAPAFEGDLRLRKGRLGLSQLGITLDQIGLTAVFNQQKLTIDDLDLRAGEGRLKGQGEVQFAGWRAQGFRVELQGEKAEIVNLPELRALASPDLQLSGNLQGLTLAGVLKIPELQVLNWHPPGRVTRSEDVVYVDPLPKPQPQSAFKLKLDLDIQLGERVVVKDRGLDVRLAGDFHLNKDRDSAVLALGQINIPAGNYSTYGVKLPITSGRLYFNGGPVDNPALDIIAMRTIGEVKAGVAVGGTARQPDIRLISDPALDDTDILSYIVLGRPTLGGSGDFNALSLAANALLSAGDSASLQQRLQNKSGLDVIDVNPGSQGGLESAVVTVGKYLTPELYLSYGRSLTTSASQLQLRYSPGKRVEIESQLGEVSGADIYYRIEFN